jgi:hypothetical protein
MAPTTQPPDLPPIDPAQRAAVDAAREIWIRRLIDYSRNNNLLYFRNLKVGSLDLTEQPDAVSRLLAGEELEVDDLIDDVEPDHEEVQGTPLNRNGDSRRLDVQHRLIAIQRKWLGNREEKGLETLFLALGIATWPAPDHGRPYAAPVLLIPAHIRTNSPGGEDCRLVLNGEPQVNLALLHVLQQEFGVKLEAKEILDVSSREDEDGIWRVDAEAACRALKSKVVSTRPFSVSDQAVLGNFQFAKMAMVEDLKRHGDALARHPLVSAVAGYGPSRLALGASGPDCDPRFLDDLIADDEHLVLDADSSQVRVIRLAADGQSGVIQGPPGTGKSQTIANLISELVAAGKRVLFVAEKRAALEAVIKRLGSEEVGLGHLALDLHGASVSRKQVMARIADTLQLIRESRPVDTEDVHRQFEDRRGKLRRHASRMNAARAPANESLFTIQGRLLRLPTEASTDVRWRAEQLLALTPARAFEVRELLTSAAALHDLFLGSHSSPWNNANIRSGERAQELNDAAKLGAFELWPALERELASVMETTGVDRPKSVSDAETLLRFFRELDRFCGVYSARVFDGDAKAMTAALSPAAGGWLAKSWAFVSNGEFRKARAHLLSLRQSPVSVAALYAEAREAQSLMERWRALGGRLGHPILAPRSKEFGSALSNLLQVVDTLASATGRSDLTRLSLDDLALTLSALAADSRTPFKLPVVHTLRDNLSAAKAGHLIEAIRRENIAPAIWSRCFEFAWLHSILDAAQVGDSDLAAFNGRTHDRYAEEFAELDLKRIQLSADRVRRLHGEHAIEAMNAHPAQADLVRREAQKRSRHIPLRELLARAPDVLTRIAPCWLASPLSVSQLLDGDRSHFDVVLFDEASQILPEEAIPSLLRGRGVVVAGDRHQLPPTNFFSSVVEGEDDESDAAEAVEGFESLLDVMSPFLPNWMLEWHYRSEDERLIAFSNHHIYDDRLITFPGARSDEVIAGVVVAHDPSLGSQDESASKEVSEVVRRVIAHAETRPQETLGVITMGIKHANRVQAALDRSLLLRPDLADFFSIERQERFFVKNLETVQGDERDAILISIGYGKTPDGDLPHRFGPLTQDSGYRRLNVAVTRARRRISVVSSFRHDEIDLNRAGSRGVKLLQAYLQYAASGGNNLPRSEEAGEVAPNPFEADVKGALEAKGITLRSQYGASRYRIDLVAMHPRFPGRPVLAIECDGATYHSGATARERDRLRQQQLMLRGWRFHRIWSTDWWNRREEEIERTLASYEEAVAYSDMVQQESDDPRAPVSGRSVEERSEALPPQRKPLQLASGRASIDEYSNTELRRLAEWAMSDGLLRTEGELMRDMLHVLGFARLGGRIRARLEAAIRSAAPFDDAGGASNRGSLRLL